ncbi:hypothetical protein DsansV1_C07g0075841 [Dioscorea sansibarensis]
MEYCHADVALSERHSILVSMFEGKERRENWEVTSGNYLGGWEWEWGWGWGWG